MKEENGYTVYSAFTEKKIKKRFLKTIFSFKLIEEEFKYDSPEVPQFLERLFSYSEFERVLKGAVSQNVPYPPLFPFKNAKAFLNMAFI